ncbi:MAG: TIGR02270 family protein [Nitrospira sp.]|nr:TIGR02270 family protein [Nitrospira sp.]MDH4243259.1 TIGR02270 family protein [Nitrospira sp.]MDH4358087.1 TIGR02270 family protein [Nitrospira sp.]MDH5317396.1 TIGR02270 family protein [Nitrospira sp.]
MIIEDIVSQHAEEAAFLWLLRSHAIRQPHYALKDLAKLDDRVEAHLDGLRVAGEPGWELCKAALGNEEAGEVFAASVMAFESGIEARIQAVLNVVTAKPELIDGMVSALGWVTREQASPHLQRFLSSHVHLHRQIGLAGCAVHRVDPKQALTQAVTSRNLTLRARALKAVGELGRRDLLGAVKENLKEEDESVRYWAAWSGALLGEPAAIPVLQRLVEAGHPQREQACALALRRMAVPEGQAWLKTLVSAPNTIRLAVQAAGVIGDPSNIPWLIQQIGDPNLARVAGESFSFITGLDLAYDDLDTDKPEGIESGPTENPEDENVEMDADEDLPWPHPQLIEKWWATHRMELMNGTRYLLGKPMTIDSLTEAVKNGKQRQRRAAAIELAMRQPGIALFNCSAPGFRQQKLLV